MTAQFASSDVTGWCVLPEYLCNNVLTTICEVQKMDLACIENSANSCTAKRDRSIFSDSRVINNLLNDEIFYIPNCDYFKTVQNDIQPFMRKIVTTWMMEVCEEQLCEDQVLPLAINLMDRFLCVCTIKKQQLQLLGATCLLIASKIRSTNLLPIDLLCAYTDYSVSYSHIVSWELLVLSKLQWNVTAVTGFDYIDQVIERCSWGRDSSLLRRHAHTLVSICYTGYMNLDGHPSDLWAQINENHLNDDLYLEGMDHWNIEIGLEKENFNDILIQQ